MCHRCSVGSGDGVQWQRQVVRSECGTGLGGGADTHCRGGISHDPLWVCSTLPITLPSTVPIARPTCRARRDDVIGLVWRRCCVCCCTVRFLVRVVEMEFLARLRATTRGVGSMGSPLLLRLEMAGVFRF